MQSVTRKPSDAKTSDAWNAGEARKTINQHKNRAPLKILKLAARRGPYEASTSFNNNIFKVSGWLTVSHFGTGFLMTMLGLGLVWLGLAAGAFHGIIAFSNGPAWFGVGNRRSHESDEYSTVRRTCPQTIDHHRDIA